MMESGSKPASLSKLGFVSLPQKLRNTRSFIKEYLSVFLRKIEKQQRFLCIPLQLIKKLKDSSF